jgi:hypothetical protein
MLEKRQLRAPDVYMVPFSWQKTRPVSRHAAPAASRSRSCLTLWALKAVMARLGRMSERYDFGVFVSSVLLADFQTWTTPPPGST